MRMAQDRTVWPALGEAHVQQWVSFGSYDDEVGIQVPRQGFFLMLVKYLRIAMSCELKEFKSFM